MMNKSAIHMNKTIQANIDGWHNLLNHLDSNFINPDEPLEWTDKIILNSFRYPYFLSNEIPNIDNLLNYLRDIYILSPGDILKICEYLFYFKCIYSPV